MVRHSRNTAMPNVRDRVLLQDCRIDPGQAESLASDAHGVMPVEPYCLKAAITKPITVW